MKKLITVFFAIGLIASINVGQANAQVPVVGNPDHETLLQATSPELVANKRIVYDFWRVVLEANQLDMAKKYLTDDYIQHNPQVPTGRKGFEDFFKQFADPKPVKDRIEAPIVAIMAEGDLVTLVLAMDVPAENGKEAYSTTWFDMFRIENGKIAEHWDPAFLD